MFVWGMSRKKFSFFLSKIWFGVWFAWGGSGVTGLKKNLKKKLKKVEPKPIYLVAMKELTKTKEVTVDQAAGAITRWMVWYLSKESDYPYEEVDADWLFEFLEETANKVSSEEGIFKMYKNLDERFK